MNVAPRLLSLEDRRKIEPKEILSCLIPCLLVVLTWQPEILVRTLPRLFILSTCQLRTPLSNGLTCDVTLQLTKCCIILLSWCTNRFSTMPSMFTGGLGKNSNQCWHQFAAENWSFHDKKIMSVNKVEVLVSGHPRNAEKVFVTGTDRLREWFSYAATGGERVKWPFKGACPAVHKN